VPTDTAPAYDNRRSISFALRGVAWSLALFGLVRFGGFETHAILPLTALQSRLAISGFGLPALPVQVTLSCSGADAMALCLGAILAYPTGWTARIGGAAGGIAMILVLNTVRIGTLGRAAAAPVWFNALHVYVWPALLTLAIAAYVFSWMRVADGGTGVAARVRRLLPHTTADPFPAFVGLTAAFLVIFTAAAPLYRDSTGVLAVGAFIARAAGAALGLLGVHAVVVGNVLSTARGGFLVTQECISTPLIPVYLAAVVAYPGRRDVRALAAVAVVPLFVILGIARLLVVALPPAIVASPFFVVHAFYQLLLAAVVVVIAASWQHGTGTTAWGRALMGGALGGLLACLLGPLYAHAFHASAPLDDPQGAIALFPSFQVGLYVALWVAVFSPLRWRWFAVGLAALGASQAAFFAVLPFAAGRTALTSHVVDVRAWALAVPVLLIVAMVTRDQPRR
jgi:exosortase/archaeosortase family protein